MATNAGKTSNRGVSRTAGALIDGNYDATLGMQTLTDAATVLYGANSGVNATVTLADNRTLACPTDAPAGASGKYQIKQDATGSRLATWASGWKWAGGTDGVLSTGANAIDVLSWWTPDGAVFHVLTLQKAMAT